MLCEMSDGNNNEAQLVSARNCSCRVCVLSRAVDLIYAKLDMKERATISEVWSRMEDAETNLAWINGKAKDGETIVVGGRVYIPKEGTTA
jgi:hypothetical protein